MKNKVILACLLLFLFIPCYKVKAYSGSIYVYYQDQLLVNRKDVYKYTKQHMESIGFYVEGRSAYDNHDIYTVMHYVNGVIFYNHGSPGRQCLKAKGNTKECLSGVSGTLNNTIFSSIKSSPYSFDNLRIVIYYGCQTGKSSSKYGDILQETVNKGSNVAIGWSTDLDTAVINTWNRLFFEHAKNNNILSSMQHADYWTYEIENHNAANNMKYNRVEKGNIYGYIYK